jgi:ribose transport system ATP-binding protein
VSSAPGSGSLALDLRSVSKSFGGVRVLHDVSLSVRPGEIHAIVGQNGSGKSTLAKVLSGFHQPEPGAELSLFETPGSFPLDGSQRRRMHFVHQDLGLVDSLGVIDNIGLSHGYRTQHLGKVDWRHSRERARSVLARFDLGDLDLNTPVGDLTASQRAIVAIARGLLGWDSDQGLLVLDETTAALPPDEVRVLVRSVREVVARGAGVLYITHRLDEVFEFTDRVSVLRDGRLVATRNTDEISREDLIVMMVGNRLAAARDPAPAREEVGFECVGVSAPGLSSVDLRLRKGEIVGVAGMLGSGRERLANALVGASRRTAGTVLVSNREVRATSLHRAMREGMALVPSDRIRRGVVPTLSVRENITLARLSPLWRRGRLSRKREAAEVSTWIDAVDLRPADPERQIVTLSGGNQQKALLARALRLRPEVLILDEPTQGVDVGAKSAIYALLREAAARGTAVLLCTAEPEDLAEVCHRVLVMRNGTIADELSGDRLTQHDVLLSCAV